MVASYVQMLRSVTNGPKKLGTIARATRVLRPWVLRKEYFHISGADADGYGFDGDTTATGVTLADGRKFTTRKVG